MLAIASSAEVVVAVRNTDNPRNPQPPIRVWDARTRSLVHLQ